MLKRIFSAITTPRTKLVLVVRGDLKMSKGKTAAQCAHAAILCYQQSQQDQDKQKLVECWSFSGQPKIVLRANTLEELTNLQNRAKTAGVVAELVRDAGRTQLEAGTATVLGIGPDIEKNVDELVSNLKLL
ncbi:PREDICTED: peptidyl-tRNA hydrolase 2, mitochondrial [Bactrocera latifrons]|uniref:peptidyl-tRNA hydrolase n=1 Tax=Bactrocera latifrons TaxID=174628 RepID=A0A0K8WEP3_BACLA|nr:PREDICTED: peptidyl-tRNA hydrolase 2, mitochondrial [Bactrocera latifrons]